MPINKTALRKIVKEQIKRTLNENIGNPDTAIPGFAGKEKYDLLTNLVRYTLGNPNTPAQVLGMMIGISNPVNDGIILRHPNVTPEIRQKIAATTTRPDIMKHAVYGPGEDAWIDKPADIEALYALKQNKTPRRDGNGLMSAEIFDHEDMDFENS